MGNSMDRLPNNTDKVLAILFVSIIYYLITINLAHGTPYSTEIMDKAKTYLHVREATNNNDSPDIDQFLAYLGLPKGLAYCISFDIFCYGKVYEKHGRKCPVPKIGRCSTWLKSVKKDKYAYTVIDPKKVEYGAVKLKPAMFSIWSHNKKLYKAGTVDLYDWAGHAELVDLQVTNVKYDTVGANTTGVDDIKLQREQTGGIKKGGPVGGVWKKHRNVSKLSSFATEAFVEVNF